MIRYEIRDAGRTYRTFSRLSTAQHFAVRAAENGWIVEIVAVQS